jgi:hypothetical protein
VHAVADDVAGHPLRHGHQLPVHHQHPVVEPGDEALDEDAAAGPVDARPVERGLDLLRVGERIETPRPWLALSGLITTG